MGRDTGPSRRFNASASICCLSIYHIGHYTAVRCLLPTAHLAQNVKPWSSTPGFGLGHSVPCQRSAARMPAMRATRSKNRRVLTGRDDAWKTVTIRASANPSTTPAAIVTTAPGGSGMRATPAPVAHRLSTPPARPGRRPDLARLPAAHAVPRSPGPAHAPHHPGAPLPQPAPPLAG